MKIETRYYGPTTHRGARIRAWLFDDSGDKAGTVTLSYDYARSPVENHRLTARFLAVDVLCSAELDPLGETLDGRGYAYAVPARAGVA